MSRHEFSKPQHERPKRASLFCVTQPLDWLPAPPFHHLPANKSTRGGLRSPPSGLPSTCLPVMWPWRRDNLPWIVFSSEFEIWGLTELRTGALKPDGFTGFHTGPHWHLPLCLLPFLENESIYLVILRFTGLHTDKKSSKLQTFY